MPDLPNSTSGYYWFLGIDPGKSGGLACIYPDRSLQWTAMPSSERDLWEWLRCPAHSAARTIAVVEQVWSSPQMGVTSAFTFGRGYGTLIMALTAAGIPFYETRPQVWQKALGIPQRKKTETQGQFKERLRRVCQQRFPTLSLWGRKKGEQMAVCDSLLIAEYCRLTYR